MQDMSEELQGVAIIGMAGRFPGAESVGELWANLLAGKECVSFFGDEELADSGLDIAALRRRGQYVAARGVLKDADCFDAAFFGIHPKEAEVMDPQQRVFLEACWSALETAGYAPGDAPGTVGVFAGATFNTYYQHVLQRRPDLIDLVGSDLLMLGNEKDYLTTRVAYKLGLKGPALNVSTACSTSLVAVCQACQSLLTYQCDMALAGGVSVRTPQISGYYYDEGNIGSADGHTRTFDEQASGTAFSNGVGVVVLKRLEEAVTDGDRIYAVIKGAALNNDGSQRVSFGAPGVEGQSQVIAMAHALAGVDPETIGYVEAHGTATPLGDPIEIAGLTKAFRLGTQAKQFCGLGSVKTNLGHLDAAAGVTGLIKTALSLHHGIIPASLHFSKPNPKLGIEDSPFYVNSALREWKTEAGVPRRAGVSSFGTGGTNAHVVLEEAPELSPSGPSRPWQLLMLSAKTETALERVSLSLSAHLKKIAGLSDTAQTSLELADAAFTLQTGRSEFLHRRIVVCRDASDGATALEAADPKRVYTQIQHVQQPPVVFMFPGQGAQYPGMGAELYRSEPVFRAEVDRCAELLRPILQADLREILFPREGSEKDSADLLVQTRYTQPALFVIEYSLAKLWMSWGIQPAAMIGHSVGEYVAGCLAGVFTLEDALSLVARRAAMVQAQAAGAMLAVRLPEKEVLPLLNPQLAIAAINSPNLCVVSGPFDQIGALEERLKGEGVAARRLNTSHAFHSPMMEPVLAPFTELLRQTTFGEPQIPYVSNVTARWITAPEAKSADYWAGHVRNTVRFADGVAELMKDASNILLEVGPGQTLSTLARQHPARPDGQVVLASLPLTGDRELRGILETLGRLWMSGVALDWHAFYADERRHRTELPTYPFERKRYWPEPAPATAAATTVVQPPVPAPSQTAEPAPVASAPPADVSRRERLLAAARSLLQDLSGYDLSLVDPSADLLELGLDSLLLTQASQLFQRKFGVAITFRQLMEELSSLDAIASHLDSSLPPEAFAPAPASVPMAPLVAPTQAVSATPALEQLLLQQQQLTNQLLQLLGRQPAAAPAASLPSAPALAMPVPPEMKSHGPFKPLDRAAGMALTPQQSSALETWIARYTRRTAESKRLAAQNRPLLADPRSAAGFKQLWKEMVYPITTTRSDGSKIWDVDGNEYVDFVMGFGASLFGHRPPFVVQAVHEQLDLGFEIGPIQPLAGEVAALIREFTGMQRVGFTNTGSEAVLAATRIARTVTGRDKIAVFAGAYHGIFDEVLFRPLTVHGEDRAASIAPGIPASAMDQVIVLDYGNPRSLEVLRARASEIAAVLVEPVQSRRLELQPREFLHEVRRITEQTGTALIFDEVVTGFRVHPGGSQAYFGVRADIATYGKVIGGGLPIGVVAGDPKFMDALDGGQWQYGDASFPEVGVTFFAGTFMRHPLALAAAKAVLLHLKEQGPALQEQLAKRTAELADRLRAIIDEFRAPYHLTQFSSLIQLGFPPDQKFAGLLFYLLRDRGIHIFENRAFVLTTAHTDEDLHRLTRAFRESLSEMESGGFLPASAPAAASVPASHASQPAEPPPSDDSRFDPFPLTEAQKEIWLAAQMGGDAALGYNESLNLQFHGAFDVELFRSAVFKIAERHPILFARISPDGQSQQLVPNARLDVPFLDLSGRNETEREREFAAIVEREVSEAFDLAAGPLLRVKIVRLSERHHVVVWTAHHIVCDGWSGGLLINELAVIYSALKQGMQPALEEPLAFRDYALATQPESPEVREATEYWRQQFAKLPPPLDLPTDRSRPQTRSAQAATLIRALTPSIHQAAKRVAGQHHTTLVVMLMAAFKTLLHRLTGQDDLVVGLGVAGQAVTGNNCLVGHCLNLLPIRSQLNSEGSFSENLAVVKKTVLDAYDHHQSTIGGILQHLAVPRNSNRPPLVEVIFNVDRDPGAAEFHGVEFSCVRNPKRALHFDLFFNFVEGPRGLLVECDYNTDIFGAATIERWIQHLQTLLESIAANPAGSLAMLPVLTEAERRELTVQWNNTAVEYPSDRCLFEFIEAQVERTPDAPAVIFEAQTISYRELNARANRLAHHLRKRGVGPETLVAVCAERSLEMMVALLGIIKAGGAYVPLDPHYPPERLALLLEDLKSPLLLTQQKFVSRLPADQAVFVLDAGWAELSAEPENNPTRLTGPTNAVYVIYTSGSTGKPKGVINVHRGIVNRLLWMQDAYGLGPSDRVLQKTPYTFDVSVWEFFWPLMTGACLVIARPDGHKDPVYLVSTIRTQLITTLHFVPSMLELFLDTPGLESLDSLRRVVCSGEALGSGVQRRFFERLPGSELHNLYGPTEASVDVTYWACRKDAGDQPVPIGKPIANTQIYVLDRRLNPVPIGVAGELHIGGVGVARGYLNRDDLTAERFIPDCYSAQPGARLYKTGDLVHFLADGNIEYLGRMDNQVKIRGLRVELGEIESVLGEQPGVRQAIVAVPPGDKTLVAYVVPKDSGDSGLEGRLREALKLRLPDYMVPSAFVLLETLPLTTSGKVDRKALPSPNYASLQPAHELIAPRTETEKALAAIWTEVLNVERFGINDDFFDLGGHSLLAIRAVSRIRNVFELDLSPRTFFANSTIAGLAKALAEAESTDKSIARITRREHTGPCPLSFAQERLWFLDQLAPGSPAYNIVDVIRFGGPLDAQVLEQALKELVHRHETLRTAFSQRDGQPVQIVMPSIDVMLPVLDLSSIDQREQQGEWLRVAREEGRTPFNFAEPPLFRGTLVHLNRQEHLLLLTIHHIIADEWSMEVLHKELHQLYQSFSLGERSPLPELPVQYTDFACWQRDWLQGELLQTQISYWKQELAGAPPVLQLPTDKLRPAMQSFRGGTEFFDLPKELLESLKSLGRREQATLFMTLEAGFMAMLHRYTGQDDILVGTPISGRTRSETEALIGLFLNTVVLRGSFTSHMNFRSLLRQVRERALGAYGHQDLPFEQLVAELAPERVPGHSPLFQVMFVLYNTEATSQASSAEGVSQLETGTSKFDLTLSISETEDGLKGLIEYSTDLFEPETIRRLCGYYGTLLHAIARDPDQSISTLPMLGGQERRELLEDRNQTAIVYPQRDRCLHHLVEDQADQTPEREALIFERQRMTYGELNRRANQLAHYLRAIGVGHETLVGLFVERSADMVVAMLGVLKAGGAYVPLDPSFPQNRLSYMIEDSGMRVVLTHQNLEQQLPRRTAAVIRLDSDWDQIANCPCVSTELPAGDPADLAYVLYTSGSTGKPKGVEIQHSAFVNFLLSMQGEPGFTAADTLLAVTTLSFDISGLEIYLPLISGGRVVIAGSDDARDPARLMKRIGDSGCTVMQATPATWRALLDAGWSGAAKLRILCGGEAFPADLVSQLLPRSAELWNMYGPTETTVWSTIHRVTSATVPVPIGRPIANTRIFLLDGQLNLVPKGAVGELYIGGSGLARGYLGRPELTQARFVQDPCEPGTRLYRTGDLARWLPDGALECLGRVDDQVKIRGYRIELGEVETILSRQAAIRQCAVVAREDTPGNQILVAYFETESGITLDVAELRAHLKRDLPDYMVPAVFVRLDKLPLTPNGKIDRRVLPIPPGDQIECRDGFVAARDPLEQLLVHIWSSVLKVKRVGLYDNFFELGGHSLLAVRIVAQIEKFCNKRLPLATLLRAPTIADLADVLRAENWNPSWASLIPLRPGGSKPPLFLMHSHGGNILEYYPLAKQLDPDQPVYAFQARGLDGSIVKNQSLEQIAASYIEELRRFQPEGPYFLGGFCFGGVLALEVAQQLSQAGQEVGLVVMIQSMHPASASFDPSTTIVERWWHRTTKRLALERANLAYRGTSYIYERLRRVWDVGRARTELALDRATANGRPRTRTSMPYILESLTIEHDRAFEAYVPRPYRGDVVLFRASRQLSGLLADSTLGWKGVIQGRLDVCDIPGHQQNLLIEPNVSPLAAELTARLQLVEQRDESTIS